MAYFERVAHLGRYRFGISHDMVFEDQDPYLERWIIWCGITLRLHKFLKGDDDRAFHDHPWWFVTMPLRTYRERTPNQPDRDVASWRPHFRSADHQHIVQLKTHHPVWTFIMTGPKSREWGFWDGSNFTPHEKWFEQRDQPVATG